MKKLKNPPNEYKDAYDAISDFYDAYIALTNCATDPSGSLQTYSSTFNDADTNTLNAYKAMELYLDEQEMGDSFYNNQIFKIILTVVKIDEMI